MSLVHHATFFITLSCAEYESADIAEYLKLVNNIPLDEDYDISRLCTEDPVSVSWQFSSKFHSFFQTVIKKCQVLGEVTHYFWKKKYQCRGAPHHHALLWVYGAPVIGKDDPQKVLDWIKTKITCQIPNDKSSPELYRLVTQFQLHKCTTYCKRKRKFGQNTFVYQCKFGYPRPANPSGKINNVELSL